MTGLQKTMEILSSMKNSAFHWLRFTMQCVDDFGGKVHTLDLSTCVKEDNTVKYIFYEKPWPASWSFRKVWQCLRT